ncbi:hypothetical protein ABG768_011217 [Culter alburnus]|uniref:Galaxin-like repeats domain-containing protein n=1 Tax=Culter alburnus TaxID=194366 RepID=A0AAW1ZEG6_CULAL
MSIYNANPNYFNLLTVTYIFQLETDYCNSLPYNPVNQICCNGTIQTRSSAHTACCGQDLYITTTQACCGGNTTLELKEDLSCCGSKSFNRMTHCCCFKNNTLEVNHKDEKCCPTPPKEAELKSPEYISCSGINYKRESGLTQCCGKNLYSLSDVNVLCCNGILHLNVPEQSECVGGLIYTQKQLKMSCGSQIYDHHKQRCCSGDLYNTTKAECCGNLLLEHNSNKICCSSSTHAMLHNTKPNHFCCGHYYYNASLWSCCAEHLKPTPSHNSFHPEYRLKPLTDLIPDICHKTVLFGKVESVVLQNNQRHIVVRVIVKVSGISEGPLLYVILDHCSSPALENGMTYLWETNNNNNNREYKPLSIPVEVTTDIHMFFTACNLNLMKALSVNTCSQMLRIQGGFSYQGNF